MKDIIIIVLFFKLISKLTMKKGDMYLYENTRTVVLLQGASFSFSVVPVGVSLLNPHYFQILKNE